MKFFRRHRYRRRVALIALLGLLFQQVTMATYLCPLQLATEQVSSPVASSDTPCHAPETPDKVRCHEHCHPITASVDHAPAPTVPPALLPATTWCRDHLLLSNTSYTTPVSELPARSHSPPLTVQHCTLQI